MLDRRKFFGVTLGALVAPFLPTDPNKIISSFEYHPYMSAWNDGFAMDELALPPTVNYHRAQYNFMLNNPMQHKVITDIEV